MINTKVISAGVTFIASVLTLLVGHTVLTKDLDASGHDRVLGTYTENEKESIVTHHLQSALFPGDIGKSIARRFAISGDTLTIEFNTTLRDGTPVTRTLVWTRLK